MSAADSPIEDDHGQDPSAPRLVLASASPRRRVLLARLGVTYQVIPAEIDEAALPDESPEAMAERLARAKAEAVAERLRDLAQARDPATAAGDRLILGSDTIVVLGAAVLGKPRDPDHAVDLLGRLTGHTHRVISGVALIEERSGSTRSLTVESRVTLRRADPAEIRAYVATGEPLDKAGAYALQGEGRRFVTRVEGSETNVIGLPLDETGALLEAAGLEITHPREAAGLEITHP